jgi:ankyrin repeat protein
MGLSTSKALLRASIKGDADLVNKLLMDRGYINVDVTNSEGSTSLILASCGGHTEIVSFLLKRNAFVNSANNKGLTSLMCASYNGHFAIVNLLVDAAADLDMINKDGTTALMLACWQGRFDVRFHA